MPISSYGRKLAPPGDEPFCRVKWQGPTSYTQVTAGSPPSGGDTLAASQFGVNVITGVIFLKTWTGNFQIVPCRIADNKIALQWRALNNNNVGGHVQTTGQEAVAGTNLSAEYVDLQVNTLSG